MAYNSNTVPAGVALVGCTIYAAWIGVVITVVVLVIRALLKYVGS